MAGDIGTQEQLVILPENARMAAAIPAVTTAKSRVAHVYGSRIMAAEAPPEAQAALTGTLETAVTTGEAADLEVTSLDSGGHRDDQEIFSFYARSGNQPGKASSMGTLLLVLLLLAATPSWAEERDYYFKQSGSIEAPCTEAEPCQSIEKAGSLRLNPGDRILFNRGDTFIDTFRNGFDWTSRSGTESKPIIISAYGSGARPIIQKNDKSGYGIILKSSDWIQISSLHIVNYQFSIELRGAQHILIEDVHLEAPGNHCIKPFMDVANNNRPSRKITVINSELDSCGNGGNGEGFYLGNNNPADGSGDYVIMNNYVHDTSFECLEVKRGTDPPITITNNTFENCHRDNHPTAITPDGDSGAGIVATGSSGGNTNVKFYQNLIKNIVGTENDHSGVGARWQSQGIDARYNVIANNQGEGLVAKGSSGNSQIWMNNTFFNNGRECTNVSGTDKIVKDNICWSNASGDDASNPQFVAAASNNFNLSPGSPALGTDAGDTNKGALQTFPWTTASILPDGITVRVTGNVHRLFQPLSTGNASAFTLTCRIAGAQSGRTFTPSHSRDALITVATPIGQGETCTLAATAGAAHDSANIGGVLAPGGPLNSMSLAVTGLLVTNRSTIPPNLLTVANIQTDCTNCRADRGCAKLLDLDHTADESSAGNSGITSFTCEHDLGSSKTLGTFRAFCNASGSWKTQEVTVKTKVNRGGSYRTIVQAGTCNASDWFSFSLEDVSARYVEITFACPSGCNGTQAMEYELTATPQGLTFPESAL